MTSCEDFITRCAKEMYTRYSESLIPWAPLLTWERQHASVQQAWRAAAVVAKECVIKAMENPDGDWDNLL